MSKKTILLLGTMDTKGLEYKFIKECLEEQGIDSIIVDASILGDPLIRPDVTREEIANAVWKSIDQLITDKDRGAAVSTMASGAEIVVKKLYEQGKFQGILGLGGSGGSSIISQAMRALPIGVPKIIVSTMASGDTRPYVGVSDIMMMHSVVDISGMNSLSCKILSNAAHAMIGMVNASPIEMKNEKPLIGATMFGVTTAAVETARKNLEKLGYEVLVFHATGTGGMSMESLVEGGFIQGVLDLTTTELADELVGGVLSAGKNRLTAAGKKGIPQVVSLGALDMVNFGPKETIPLKFKNRLFCKHNAAVTLMRTTPEECTKLGEIIAKKLNQSTGPVTLFIPLKGVSMISVANQIFYDTLADTALFEALRKNVDPQVVTLKEVDTDVNDPLFAKAMAECLHESMQKEAVKSC